MTGLIDTGTLLLLMIGYTPLLLEIVLPLALFISILLIFGRMHAEHEMIILNMCGITNYHLLQKITGLLLLTCVITATLSLWITPWSLAKSQKMIQAKEHFGSLHLLHAKQFVTTKNMTYFIGNLSDKCYAQNILIVKRNPHTDRKAMTIFTAPSGMLALNLHPNITLDNGYRYYITPGEAGGEATHYDQIKIWVPKKQTINAAIPEKSMSTRDILASHSKRAQAEWQWRISLIIMVPVIILLALALSKINPRQGRYFKLLPSMLIYVLYLTLMLALRGLIAEGYVEPYPGLYGINALFFFIACTLLCKKYIALWLRNKLVHTT